MNNNRSSGRREDDARFADIRTVLAKYIYHWPIFLLGLILALSAAYIYVKSVNPVYKIGATILVKDEKKVPQEKTALQELDQSSAPKNAETEIQILKSSELVSRVVTDLSLWVNYKSGDSWRMAKDIYKTSPVKFLALQELDLKTEQAFEILIKDQGSYQVTAGDGNSRTFKFNEVVNNDFGKWMLKPTEFTKGYVGKKIKVVVKDASKVTNEYVKALDIHLLDKATPTIGIFLDDEVPERGKLIVNYLIKSYNEVTSSEEKRSTESTLRFINDRLASLTGELNSAEDEVEGYRSSQGLTDINSQSKVYLENVQANDNKLNEVNVQLNIIDGIERYVNSTSNNENPPATVGISDPALNSLIDKVAQLQLKRSALLATTPIGNPVFEPLERQINTTKIAIKQNIGSIKSSLLAAKRELQSFNNKFESSIRNIPGQERQFIGKKRQQSIKENLYVYLLQKKEEVSLSYASTLADARIVDKANVEDTVWPKMSLILAIALLAGFGLPFLLIFFRSALKNKVVDRNQIQSAVGIKVLSEFSKHDEDTSIFTNNNHIIGEQFKYLRTNLHYLHENKKGRGRVTLLTSSVSNEGKSFISSNLAVSLANTGRRTVILEMDLRRPKISSIFNLDKKHQGISEYLASDMSVNDIVQATNIENLFVLSSGDIPPNPSELLEKDRLEQLLDALRETFDDIIIDSPPVHLVTDAIIISRVTDVSLYIIRQGETSRSELSFIREIYEDEKLPKMNVIFNGVTAGKYGYGYSYDTSYYTHKSNQPALTRKWKLFLNRF
ncbi:GumC family protein [Mucilaginibacter aquariorum]|uniref:non-specific protein-tyrosine kinase n=1 Tax=Mucilaginibacter aquariorum TaxID=2967225 RepID=A0ABT1SVN1_9SPHI|nr:tyrosine-protein kinase family protein [Mucilaginibacter aquariorum]MCQ6956322.1 polysaccharide biosynthesis tyrosine autokinase [Mucilaginibacter aquariorum]